MTCRRVITIDCDYLEPRFAAAYLVHDGSEALYVDNNTAHSVPKLLEALLEEGLRPEQVRYLVVTHVHLDHAGGTSRLLLECPNATVLVHPRGRRHLVDPSKLIASAIQVYGAERFQKLYGEISAIPEERVQSVEDGERVNLGTGPAMRVFHTRGHANHHFCLEETETRSVFSGDAFGLAYPALQKQGLFILPSTSPTDFDYEAAVESVDRIVATGCERVYPTHFGEVTEVTEAARMLKDLLLQSKEILDMARKSGLSGEELTSFCRQESVKRLDSYLRVHGILLTKPDWDLLKLDLDLNAQGLAFVARKPDRESHV